MSAHVVTLCPPQIALRLQVCRQSLGLKVALASKARQGGHPFRLWTASYDPTDLCSRGSGLSSG